VPDAIWYQWTKKNPPERVLWGLGGLYKWPEAPKHAGGPDYANASVERAQCDSIAVNQFNAGESDRASADRADITGAHADSPKNMAAPSPMPAAR
jgi:hypothetical protein